VNGKLSMCRICGKEIKVDTEFDDFHSDNPAHMRCVLAREVKDLKLVCMFLAQRVIELEQMRGVRVNPEVVRVNLEALP